jgi:tetratricopeptide (TPR) repeat protein
VKGFSAVAAILLCLAVLLLGTPPAESQQAPAPSAAAVPAAAETLSPEALYQFSLAKLLAVEGSLSDSLAAYDEAERLAPGSAYVRLEHAQLLARVAQFARVAKARQELLQKASATVNEARRLAPGNLDVLRAVGSIFLDLSAQDPSAMATAQQALEAVRAKDPADAQSVIPLAQLYMDQQKPDQAAEVLRDLVTRVPNQRMAYALLVEALLRSGKQKEAESALQDILGLDPGSLEARLTLVDLFSQRGDHQAALAVLRGAPEEVRGEPRLRRKVAWELYQTGDLDGALSAAEAVLGSAAATSPDGDSMRLLKGLILSAQGKTEEAITLLDKIRESDPENLPLAITVAHLFQRVGRNDQAVAILGKLAESLARDKKTKEEREVRLELGQVLLAAKEWDRAEAAVAPLLDARDDTVGSASGTEANTAAAAVRAQALLIRVDALVAAKRWDDALAVLDKNSAGPNGALASALATRRAEVLLRSGREAEGRKTLNDLAASSDNSTILAAAQSFQRVDRYPESIPVLQRLVSRQPESAVGHYLLGAAFERTGKRSEAVAELRRVLQIDPDFHAALNYLGYTLAEAKENLDEALSLIQRAVALEPDNGAYVDSLGWTYYQLGRNEQARGYLERAARLEPADATLQEHLGDVYVALGQNDRAREAYQRALELGNDNTAAAKVRQKLDSLDHGAAKPQP